MQTFGDPGVQDAGITGMHETGVSTPCAAAVAAATCGLLGVVHITNGLIFTIGLLSVIVPAAIFPALTLITGGTAI